MAIFPNIRSHCLREALGCIKHLRVSLHLLRQIRNSIDFIMTQQF